jgi:hypothetical protein
VPLLPDSTRKPQPEYLADTFADLISQRSLVPAMSKTFAAFDVFLDMANEACSLR